MKVKIGAVQFNIVEADDLRDGAVLLNGVIKFEGETISYEKALSIDKRKITLIHEILHGIVNHAGGVHDESQIEMYANGLHQVLTENEGAMKEILWGK